MEKADSSLIYCRDANGNRGHFGSLKRLREADVEQIAQVPESHTGQFLAEILGTAPARKAG